MQTVLQISGLAVTVAVIALVAKNAAPQISAVISIAAGIFILLYITDGTSRVIGSIMQIVEKYGLNQTAISVLVKLLGISVVSNISAEMCRDMNENALAAKIEVAASVISVAAVMPVLSKILEAFNNLF